MGQTGMNSKIKHSNSLPDFCEYDVSLIGVTKRFQNVVAVDNVSLDVRKGEFLCILGPSGCGKTTTMRIISGFEKPDSGIIKLAGRDVTALPPEKRDTRMVFQNYALFPHMTVFDNVAFGLRMLHVPKMEIKKRVLEVLSLVKLEGLENRKPIQLSGGQQQRVALARAIVPRPTVLLLDEPLGALDLKLRKQMQIELKAIQHEVGITFVYVTHDQDESLTMADRIAVMKEGHIEQIGTPVEIYENPVNAYVCDFVGVINMFKGVVSEKSGQMTIIKINADIDLNLPEDNDLRKGQKIIVGVRPEKIVLASKPQDNYSVCIPCQVTNVNYQGTFTGYTVELQSGNKMNVMVQNLSANKYFNYGDKIYVHWANESLKLFPQ